MKKKILFFLISVIKTLQIQNTELILLLLILMNQIK